MTHETHQLHNDLAAADMGELSWDDIDMADVIEAMDDDDFVITVDQMKQLVEAKPEFSLGTDHYERVIHDHGVAGYRSKDWSYLHFTFNEHGVYVHEAHPY